jgi:hypothetical protein
MLEQYQKITTRAATVGRDLDRVRGVHRAGTANRATDLCAVERFVNDLADCASAAAALGAAAEASVDMAGGPTRCIACGASYFMVAQNIAGANDHRTPKFGYSLTGALR